MHDPIVEWAKELQSLAQAGLWYGRDPFDRERYERIRAIAAEMMAMKTGLSVETVTGLFCGDIGYQTPKLDTRAALFEGDAILLVRERDGRWSLPGGWCEFNLSPTDSALKEVREEAGLDAEIIKLIAVQDRDKHNKPQYAYGVVKLFYLCRALGGAFAPNLETTERAYFPLDALPALAEEKNTEEQIEMCFAARRGDWRVMYD